MLCLLVLFCRPAIADSKQGNAVITLQSPVDLSEISTVSFGTLASANGDCIMSADGKLSADKGGKCSGSGNPGEFKIQGAEDSLVSIEVFPGDSILGVSFTPILVSESEATLTGGTSTIRIAGKLNINNASVGSRTLSYTLSVNYH